MAEILVRFINLYHTFCGAVTLTAKAHVKSKNLRDSETRILLKARNRW